jgi:hypothetical protein
LTAAELANVFVQSALQIRREMLREQVAQLLARLRNGPTPATRARIADLRTLGGGDPTISLGKPRCCRSVAGPSPA